MKLFILVSSYYHVINPGAKLFWNAMITAGVVGFGVEYDQY